MSLRGSFLINTQLSPSLSLLSLHLAAGLKAGDLLRDLAAIAGGKGGGKPDQARGAAPDRSKLEDLKASAAAKF